MDFFAVFILGVILSLQAKEINADYPKSDELTLRNQLLADVYFLKEGVDKLLISSEILNKRFTNHMDILKTFQDKLKNDNYDSAAEQTNVCEKITGMFNATVRKQNVLESRLMVRLEELQEDQLMRFEEMLLQLRLNKSCGATQTTPPKNTLTLWTATLSEVSEKIQQLEDKITKFELLEKNLNDQQEKLNKFADNQMQILQQINEKLAKNHEHFDKINQDLTSIKELNADVKNLITRPRPKLPMEVILGLTTANVTNFK